MNYLLVKTTELDEQGYTYQYAEHIPDGRVILPLSALKVLSNFTPDIISGERLKALIKEQQESGLYDDVDSPIQEEENIPADKEESGGELQDETPEEEGGTI